MITLDGVDGPAPRAVEELDAAGVEVLATLSLTRSLAETENEENATVLEDDPRPAGRRSGGPPAGRRGGARGPPGRGRGSRRGRRARSVARGRVRHCGPGLDPAGLLGIGGAGQLVVLAAGGAEPAGLPTPEVLLVPLTDRLVRLGVPTTAAGPSEDAYGFVSAVRGASEIRTARS